MTYEELEARLAEWAKNQPSVRAVLTVGSRARGTADRWSDLDVLILTTDRAALDSDPSWLGELGDAWLTYKDEAAPGDPEWFVMYDGGLKFDAVLLDVADPSLDLDTLLAQYPYQGVFARGAKVLFDRAGQPRTISPKAPKPAEPPSAEKFAHIINGFLVESVTTAKFIGRGDYWRAQHWFAHDLRPRMLTLVEWHAHGKDTWYEGRYLEQWADPRALTVLNQSFTSTDRAPMIRAMRNMLSLFRTLGEETAARHGLTYPTAAHEKVVALIGSIFVAKPE
jgi:aminoglycoside 6-adenylyltransferase